MVGSSEHKCTRIMLCFGVAEVAPGSMDGIADLWMDSLPKKRVLHKKPPSS
jgi:hypothetical protein